MSPSTRKLWTCPECGREFAKRNQVHSCVVLTVDEHFENRSPHLREIYERLVERLKEIGPVRITPVKSAITFASTYTFLAAKLTKSHIDLEFFCDRELDDERIAKTFKIGAGRYAYTVRLTAPDEIDEWLINWLGYAYHMQL